ncbi:MULTISPECIES: hypothetical protein [Thermoanaerobacterium]|uniref:Uncharacterized protein n=3 Tax=Thermoanaerobacterium TaxID=28895 RepID=L0INB2_THETR|nr:MULTISPECIES: hypothetical protein [Thermoanaerobacterium]AFK94300.1 hypothetical protein Tsac_2753 [Thermoanaerobacterium saccharolyticum JW/SL-YS485]AGB20338.1 hypothetical protein Thethe_02784 [Thermoanaerobacterium thermosaccharolyticum M0795]ETO37216.1 hypothetical protein V518_2621 [Thermoanaerobacterium aotearoense SCUT27]
MLHFISLFLSEYINSLPKTFGIMTAITSAMLLIFPMGFEGISVFYMSIFGSIFGLLLVIPSTRILSIFWLMIGFTVAVVYDLYERKKHKEYIKEQEEYTKGLNKVLNDYNPVNIEITNKLGIEYQAVVTFNNGESANIRFINGRNVQYAILPDIYNKSKYHSEIKEMIKKSVLKNINE